MKEGMGNEHTNIMRTDECGAITRGRGKKSERFSKQITVPLSPTRKEKLEREGVHLEKAEKGRWGDLPSDRQCNKPSQIGR